MYSCRAKFESECGWPAFDKCFAASMCTRIDDKYVKLEKFVHRREVKDEASLLRLEIVCSRCDWHLGHVFPYVYPVQSDTRTNQRHCVNSKSIRYVDALVSGDLQEEMLDISGAYKAHVNVDQPRDHLNCHSGQSTSI